ncbi:TlpA disulfide reductase family protein [Mucilaginibacter psychrotolerans]|uniref:AhpC/TSA family protein n=1 Tax=Mucilaginibacter psychrotolerans TaxID=1524096 RepID=A0A4Y8SP54_9SPHI|nr:TlpA disulfide reductase family protein [Mucilaginibacter psychrotolerans]TFF40843.1 AhpC/TSA family protein [Mucilaginibacter psychrotolerans]
MKNCLSLLFAFFLFNCAAFAQTQKPSDNFELHGTLSHSKTRVLWLRYRLSNEKQVAFKALVKKGSFTFKGYIPSPLYAEFYFDYLPQPNRGLGLNPIFLSSGKMSVSLVENEAEKTKITGSAMQDDWDKLQLQKAPLQKEVNLNDWNKIQAEEKQIDYKFIVAHPNSYLSPYLIDYYFDGQELRLDSASNFYKSLTAEVKSSFAAKILAAKISKHQASAAGGIAPLFSIKDIHGKILSLKSFRDKNYVLVYFWASWCFYKGNESAFLKSCYSRYHTQGLEIVGISQDIFMKEWKNKVHSKGLGSWYNIRTIPGGGRLEETYNIKSMPPMVLVLIDKEGKIMGRYFGEHPDWIHKTDNEGTLDDLDRMLAKTFGL